MEKTSKSSMDKSTKFICLVHMALLPPHLRGVGAQPNRCVNEENTQVGGGKGLHSLSVQALTPKVSASQGNCRTTHLRRHTNTTALCSPEKTAVRFPYHGRLCCKRCIKNSIFSRPLDVLKQCFGEICGDAQRDSS